MSELRFIEPRGPLYRAEQALRYRVLREPLGLPPGTEEFAFERDSLHLVALDGEAVVGCVLFQPDGRGGGRLYQMAVEPERQGTGLGTRLVRRLEDELLERGLREVVLHARLPAIGFYARLGYGPVGAEYEEVGIPHRNMRKTLKGPGEAGA